MLVYEFIYTGIGQFVAAPAPNATFASLINPLLIGTLVSFCGVLVPYAQIQVRKPRPHHIEICANYVAAILEILDRKFNI
jgi:hypothetical protein